MLFDPRSAADIDSKGSGRMSTIERRPTDVSLEEFETIFESVKNWGGGVTTTSAARSTCSRPSM